MRQVISRQVISKGMLTAAAATGILSLSGGGAFAADADGSAADSPGILSGNSVQAPLEVPVNACGNTADAAAALNPTTGNSCANSGGSTNPQERPAATTAAEGEAGRSPGILSGNSVQAPVKVPVNLCGNTADAAAGLNPSTGNSCANDAQAPSPTAIPEHETPPAPHRPDVHVPGQTDRAARYESDPAVTELSPAGAPGPQAHSSLAATGSDENLAAVAAGSAALLIGGGILYRRGAAASRH
ncbi:chaplin [Streptomyces sp. NPDC050658]|uniref:chaplin n=1 Tax=unclassified Streptomyces TaxID=2593676 RepID=UPI003445729F